jgi:hypothetical protein
MGETCCAACTALFAARWILFGSRASSICGPDYLGVGCLAITRLLILS